MATPLHNSNAPRCKPGGKQVAGSRNDLLEGGPRKRWHRILGVVAYMTCVILAIEVASRLAWTLDRRVPFFAMHRMLEGLYRPLQAIMPAEIRRGDGIFDVLLLGGSVIGPNYPVDRILEERLSYAMGRRVRVHNAAFPAHTTRDSLYKYRYLMDKAFDLVLVYHGINDTRANNCPPEVFRQDYSHLNWYRFIHAVDRHPELPYVVFPYSLHFAWMNLQGMLGAPHIMPFRQPKPEWTTYGATIKTRTTFRNNLLAIVEIARQKGEPLMLMTFGHYLAKGYTLERFVEQGLDYTRHNVPVEIWGRPEHVVAGMEVHNAVVREVASQHEQVVLLDQQRLMPKRGEYFLDICHLTVAGGMLWVENVVRRLEALETQ